MRLTKFGADPEIIADQFNITVDEADAVVEGIKNLSFTAIVDGKLKRASKRFNFQGKKSHPSIRNCHKQMTACKEETSDAHQLNHRLLFVADRNSSGQD